MTLKDQRVLVLGGSSGIGLAVAELAQERGAEVIIASRNAEKLARARRKLGPSARAEVVDGTNESSVRELFSAIGMIDHLVVSTHDAGDSLSKTMRPLLDIDIPAAQTYLASRFWCAFICTKNAIPHLSERGSVTLTSGVVARGYVPNHSLLAGNNAGIEAFARKVAVEIAPKRINVISPGLTLGTETYENVPPETLKGMADFFARNLPVRFVATSRDIAPAYLFCMTMPYLTGVYIDMDGGFNVWDPEKQQEGSFSAT